MLGINVEGNRTNFDGGYMQPMTGIMTNSTPFSIYTPVNAPPTVTDTGLTSNHIVSRKRSRDLVTLDREREGQFPFQFQSQSCNHGGSFVLSLSQIQQQQQLEMDQIFNRHMENVRIQIEEKRNRDAEGIAFAVEQVVMKKLRVREEEFEKIGKINTVLEDKVKSLYIENQLWRELAQTNEETANALRNNLEQALAHVHHENDDAVLSCCGSNNINDENYEQSMTAAAASGGERRCRRCGREEASVLVLPCRHLCLCTDCGSSSSVYTCPICKCTKTACVHIKLQ